MARLPTDASIERPDDLPDRYRLIEVIGIGGVGRVYRAHDAIMKRDVAIKVIEKAPKAGGTLRFVREAQAGARLVHPHIVSVHDVDPEAGWLVMELVEGKSLKDLGRLPPAEVRKIAEQVLGALDAAHASGVVHRDVKPSNIMIDGAGNVKLVDFGVARLVDAEMTTPGESFGTPAYMSPEQVRGAPTDARTDIYGLGATLFEVVTGERMVAFETPSPATLAKLGAACVGEPSLARLIEGCLQADPDARWSSARDALEVLRGRARGRRKWLGVVAALVVLGALGAGAYMMLRPKRHVEDPRLAEAFLLAQRGENEKAARLYTDYLAEHPDDPDALTMQLLVAWWEGGVIADAQARAKDPRLRPEQRALIAGIDLMTLRRDTEAIAFLENVEREHPKSVEVEYALGEARWHGQHLEEGVATLERAFAMDPRWQIALHHVIEFRAARGEAGKLRPLADKLRAVDAPAAAALDCKIAIGERKYADAVKAAKDAIAREPSPELYICLAQAQALVGDLGGGEQTAKRAFELWPIDLREWGGFAQYAEFFLYRGKLAEYLELLGNKPSRQKTIALALWQPPPGLVETIPNGTGMRMPPLGTASYILVAWTQHRDEAAVYSTYPEPEVRAYGEGLWAETRGDLVKAIAKYHEGLAAPAKGDMRMLLAHHLARTLVASEDAAGAAAACDEVIAPRLYVPYRAAVLPDCLLWSGDRAKWQQLVDAWTGAFEHPAVIEARKRLSASP